MWKKGILPETLLILSIPYDANNLSLKFELNMFEDVYQVYKIGCFLPAA